MTTLRRLFRNTSVLIVANAIQPLLSFYLIVTISRVLEVEGLGAYATVFNYQAIFQIFAAFGLRNLLTRNLAQQPQATARYLWHGSLLVLPFSLLSIVGLIALTALLQYPELVFWATVIVSASLIAAALIEVGEGVLAGLERLHMVGYSAIFENVLRVGLSLIVLAKGYGLLALVWIFVASRYSRALFYFWYIHRHLLPASVVARGKLDLDWTFARQLLRQAPVFALTMICVTVYWKVDISILSKARGLEE
ncbi:MAG: oligosaccharide flippase family protein, partial [candidate division KSB1 bacterium]|nr:oligosaccharide flippase family protein [candidate division KSB1 bacterium]